MSDSCNDTYISELYDRHFAAIWRVCCIYLKHRADIEDIIQETFLRVLTHHPVFENERHERSWLTVTAANLCKDFLKRAFRTDVSLLEDDAVSEIDFTEATALRTAIQNLPDHYKLIIFLHYYEEYSLKEIAVILHLPQATVRTRIRRARVLLKKELGDDIDHT